MKKLISWLLPISYSLLVTIPSVSADNRYTPKSDQHIVPIPETLNLDTDKVKLGKRLFNDPKLSADGTVSCANCHNLDNFGTDSLPQSIGINGQKGAFNSPTVFNSGLLFRQFWNGRVETLEEQVNDPITNPIEMGNSWPNVISYINEEESYTNVFLAIYGQSANKDNIANAIAEFERSLLTPNSPFDRYLKGDESAIDVQTKQGYGSFKILGCISCHQGVAVGGNMFEKLGVVIPYYEDKIASDADLGRYKLTGIEEQKYEFKVPSLRNVARTAPYFHNGSIATLEEAVKIMAKHQLGRSLTEQEIKNIVKFLKSLNGELNVK